MYFYIPTDYILNNPIHLLISNIIYLTYQPAKQIKIYSSTYISLDRYSKKKEKEKRKRARISFHSILNRETNR